MLGVFFGIAAVVDCHVIYFLPFINTLKSNNVNKVSEGNGTYLRDNQLM